MPLHSASGKPVGRSKATPYPDYMPHDTYTLYEVELGPLHLFFANGTTVDMTFALTSGRANYLMFQHLVSHFTGLLANSEGGAADLCDTDGRLYEVKSYKDAVLHPNSRHEWFHTAASSTFGPNNHGPRIKKLLADGKYNAAMDICKQVGYSTNDFYVYTNTSEFALSVPFRFFILPTQDVLTCLSEQDPRLVSRARLLGLIRRRQRLA